MPGSHTIFAKSADADTTKLYDRKHVEKAEKAVTKMKKEKADLDKIKAAKIQVPAYWTDKDSKSTGFKMQPVDFGTQSLLEQAMNTSTWSKKSGEAPYDASPYSHLGVAKAWRCEVRSTYEQSENPYLN